MAALTINDLVERNKQYAQASYNPRPNLSELADAGLPPLTTVVITCADPRISPEQFLGLQPVEAVLFRNAGGRVKTVLSDLAALDSLLGHGQLQTLVIIHHSDCGASHMNCRGIKTDILSRHPDQKALVESMVIPAFGDRTVAESVKDDIAEVQAHPLISDVLKKNTFGFTVDIKTGLLTPV